jgi:hypothetical protein
MVIEPLAGHHHHDGHAAGALSIAGRALSGLYEPR